MTSSEILNLVLIAIAGVVVLWLLWAWVRVQKGRAAPPQAPYTMGLSALIGGDRRGALRYLKEAVQLDSENLDAYVRMGDLLRESGEVQKALAVHRDLTVRPRLSDGDRVRILESLTRDYLAAGRFEEAGQSAERLRHIDRHNRFAFRALREVAEALKDWPRAIQVAVERAKIDPQRDKRGLARYHGFVGSRQLAEGSDKEARQRFEEALKLDPECLLALLYLGDMDAAAGHVDKAVAHWRGLALKAPDRAGLVFDRVERAYFEMGQFGEVIALYREILHRAPREASVPPLLALAEIHRRKGDLDEAETFVQEASEVDPEHPRVLRALVKLALDRHDPQKALARVDRLLTLLPNLDAPGACRFCETELHEPAWRCPRCQAMDPLGI
jgi:lipopolysaccharide biosynthesis regulator YciM